MFLSSGGSTHVEYGIGRFREHNSGTSQCRCHPYTELAYVYDALMDHVNYPAWSEYIAAVLGRFKPDARTILELACGTGSLSLELVRRGFSVTCSDISPPMLRRAAGKFRQSEMPVRIFAADIRTLPVTAYFDAVLCLYDSMNYLTTPDDFSKAVREAASAVASGGLFVFDVCTIRNSELFFNDRTMVVTCGNVTYERICRYDRTKRIQENHFVFERPGGKPVTESHYQKIYRLDEIERMLEGAPFIEIGRFDDMSFESGSENSERVHFVLQKEY